MSAGSIVLSLLLKTGSFETDTQRASRAMKRVKKDTEELGESASMTSEMLSNLGTTLAGAFTIAGAAAMIRQTAEMGAQIQRLAALSNTTTTEFQMLAAGARQVGVEQDQLADIFKDVQERVGEFLQTGGGPMKDFFEQIAPRVNLTAEAFRNLSGPQAMQMYVKALEDAGLNQAEMIFYMEQLAGQSSALLPLLQNNAKGFQDAGDQAQRLGQIMDESAIKTAVEFNIVIKELEASFVAIRNTIVTEMFPTLIRLSDEFRAGMENSKGFFDALATFGTMGPVKDAAEGLAKYRKELTDLEATRAAYLRTAGRSPDQNFLARDIENARQRVAYFESILRSQEQRAARMSGGSAAAVAPRPLGLPAPAATTPRGSRPSAPRAAADPVQQYTESLRRQLEAMDELNASERVLRDIQLGRLGAISEPQRAALLAIAGEIDGRKELARITAEDAKAAADAAAARDELARQGASLLEQTRTPAERLNAEYARLNDLLQKGAINWDTYSRATMMAQESFERATEAANETMTEMDQFAKNAAENIQRNLGDTFVSLMEGNFKDVASSFTSMINRMVAEAAAAQLSRYLFGEMVEGGSGSGALGNIISSFANSIFGARATGGDVMGGGAYLVGEQGPELFVPRTTGTILPNSAMGGGNRSMSIVNNFTIQGNVDKRTQLQIAREANMALQRGQRNM